MADMPRSVHRFVLLLFVGWAGFAAWSAFGDDAWMRWLLVLFLVGCISFLRRSNDATAATLLPPAAMALSFGLDALHTEDLLGATVSVVVFLGLLALVVRGASPPDDPGPPELDRTSSPD